tara:strand:+ start:817 stop:1227 length:411 start_codon:yes stop_codon:yes gene_type:complete
MNIKEKFTDIFRMSNFIPINANEEEELAFDTEKSEKKEKLTPKEKATKKGEPWFTVVNVDIDTDNPRNGSFELDWNEPFVEMLRKHGLVGNEDEDVVDIWFQDLCKQIALDSYEEDVFPEPTIQQTLTEDGKREYK